MPLTVKIRKVFEWIFVILFLAVVLIFAIPASREYVVDWVIEHAVEFFSREDVQDWIQDTINYWVAVVLEV